MLAILMSRIRAVSYCTWAEILIYHVITELPVAQPTSILSPQV
jgi:hypothetical protein